MDEFLDRLWAQIGLYLNASVMFVDRLLSPLEVFGPGFVIFVIAFAVALFTRVFSRFYITKRYLRLEQEFRHWQQVRQEAMKHPDAEKGKLLAKNVDQAKLNHVYYDYFFEGLMKSFITNVLPILVAASYVTAVYTPSALMQRFGTKWVYSFGSGSSLVNISSLFWYIICLLLSFVLIFLVKILVIKKQNEEKQA